MVILEKNNVFVKLFKIGCGCLFLLRPLPPPPKKNNNLIFRKWYIKGILNLKHLDFCLLQYNHILI